MKKLLMIALDFPPCKSAGVQRTQKFVEFLPKFGWEPVVLTAKPFIYDAVSSDPIPSIKVYRAFGLNTFKHLSFKGKHFDSMTKPDRYFTWYWHGVMLGRKAIQENTPDVVWSTFPCSTANKIARKISLDADLPWVADFRDPFAGTNPNVRAKNIPGAVIDKNTVADAKKLVFSTRGSLDAYRDFYPELDSSKLSVITNGYNEEEFADAEKQIGNQKNEGYTLLHSGALYPGGRDPKALIRAVASMKKENKLVKGFQLVFRGAILDQSTMNLIDSLGVKAEVVVKESISYKDSIKEMLNVDALLLLQGEMFNSQIPGKAYEYLRSGKPVLTLSHEKGGTTALMKEHEGVYVADMNIEKQIIKQLEAMLADRNNCFSREIGKYSRENTALQLASLLDSMV